MSRRSWIRRMSTSRRRTTATIPTIAANNPNTIARPALTTGLVALSRTVPTTCSIVSARSAAHVGSVRGLPGIAPRLAVGADPRCAHDDGARRDVEAPEATVVEEHHHDLVGVTVGVDVEGVAVDGRGTGLARLALVGE